VDGTKIFSWTHDPIGNVSVWDHYYNNGRKRVESTWNTNPQARDLARNFRGLVANGPAYGWNRDGTAAYAYSYTNGVVAGSIALPPPQP
jgi:hypothetical protein